MDLRKNTYIWLRSGTTIRHATKGFHLFELYLVICILTRFSQHSCNPYPQVFGTLLFELEFTSFNAFRSHMNSHRLLGPKMKYLPLAAKQYTYEICNKGFPYTRVLYGHMHPHKVRPTQPQPLPQVFGTLVLLFTFSVDITQICKFVPFNFFIFVLEFPFHFILLGNRPLLSWRNRIQFILLPNLPYLTYQSKHEYREEQVDQQWTIISLKALAV
ncbi:hypothetical protein GBA52_024281 [Prunus armeniaca]|nr:hypothetical protein GBA52_024281 [Prunus armeniaca]